MNKKLRTVLIVVFLIIAIVSAVMLIKQFGEYQKGKQSYNEAESLVKLPDISKVPERKEESEEEEYVDPYAELMKNMDFAALKAVNSDVQGWIFIPGTTISYPLMQGSDNDKYLYNTWNNVQSAVGAIFMDYQCSYDLSDFNTIVYGHRMNNGSMFAGLKYFNKQTYYETHPYIYVINDMGTYCYEIFSVYEVSVAGGTYELSFADEQSKQEYIDYCVNQSVVYTGSVPTTSDYIITLSTCTGNGHATRWVVQGVRSDDGKIA